MMKRGRRIALSLSGLTVIWSGVLAAAQQELPQPPSGFQDALAKILQFIYTIAHWIGSLITNIIQAIVPAARIPNDLVDTIGLLGVLTLFLVIAEVAKKLTWIVVIVGWVLVLVRVAMVIVQG